MAKVIEPNELTLTTCSVAESDANDGPAWDAATTYAKDAPVRYKHVRYKSTVDSNKGKDPSLEANNSGTNASWRTLMATEPYKMLDNYMETKTTGVADTPLTFTLPFDHANSFALLNISGESIDIKITDGDGGDGILFEESLELIEDIHGLSLFEYCFSKIKSKTSTLNTDISYGVGGKVDVTLHATAQAPALGHVVVGTAHYIGSTEFEADKSVLDFSKVIVDEEFGITKFVRRPVTSRVRLPLFITPDQSDYVISVLESLRAKPCVWVGDNTDNGFEGLTVYGWLEDWSVVYKGPSVHELSVAIRGLI